MHGSTLIQEIYESKTSGYDDRIFISVGNTDVDFEFMPHERRIIADEELVLKSVMDEKVEELESQIEKLQEQINGLEGTVEDKNDEISSLRDMLDEQ